MGWMEDEATNVPAKPVVPASAPGYVQVPIAAWTDVQNVARKAAATIPTPPPEAQVKPASTPASDALGVTQALTTGQPPVQAAVAALPEAFTQAAGGPVAKTPLGSLLGVGLGGAATGTGPLPGALGVAASQLFGQNGVPTPARFPTIRIILEVHPSFKRALEHTGTSMATNLWHLHPRVLGDFRAAFMDLAAMRHEDEFRAALLTLLRELVNHVSMGLGASLPPLSTGLTVPLPSVSQVQQSNLAYWASHPGITDMPTPRVATPISPQAQTLANLIHAASFSGKSSQPLLVGSGAGQPPIAAVPVRASGVVPMTVVPASTGPVRQVVVPGMATAVTTVNAPAAPSSVQPPWIGKVGLRADPANYIRSATDPSGWVYHYGGNAPVPATAFEGLFGRKARRTMRWKA